MFFIVISPKGEKQERGNKMKTRKELLAENRRLKKKLKRKIVPLSLYEVREEAKRVARKLQAERDYRNLYNSRVAKGLCGRCASSPCVCE